MTSLNRGGYKRLPVLVKYFSTNIYTEFAKIRFKSRHIFTKKGMSTNFESGPYGGHLPQGVLVLVCVSTLILPPTSQNWLNSCSAKSKDVKPSQAKRVLKKRETTNEHQSSQHRWLSLQNHANCTPETSLASVNIVLRNSCITIDLLGRDFIYCLLAKHCAIWKQLLVYGEAEYDVGSRRERVSLLV